MSYQVFGNPAFPYGTTSRLYGSGASSDTVTYWTIEVDWDNAGTYSGQSEALYCIGFESNRGRTTKFEVGSNGDFIGYKMPDVGTCRITLDNSTRRFDPYYTSGALYGKLLPGRFIRVRVTYQGVTYPIFHGNISKITPYDNVEQPTVVLDCEDGKRWLMNTETESAGVNSGNALTKIDQLMTAIYPTRLGGVVIPRINACTFRFCIHQPAFAVLAIQNNRWPLNIIIRGNLANIAVKYWVRHALISHADFYKSAR